MKTYLLILATCLFATFASAQEIYHPGEHNNLVFAELEETDEPEEMPVNIYLTNPNISIGSADMYLYIDDNSVNAFCYDEDEEDYMYDLNSKRCNKKTVVKMMETDEENANYPSYLWLYITNDADFKLNEGLLITIYIDATQLNEGNHVLHIVDPICSYASLDGSSSATYECSNFDLPFTYSNGLITLMNPLINMGSTSDVCLDLQGRRVNNATKGIYIVNGKKVIK